MIHPMHACIIISPALGHQLARPNPTEVQTNKSSVTGSASSGQLHHQQLTPEMKIEQSGKEKIQHLKEKLGEEKQSNEGKQLELEHYKLVTMFNSSNTIIMYLVVGH